MKFLLLFLLFLCSYSSICAQSILGLWQYNDTTVAAGYQQHYVFKANNQFEYHKNEGDGLSRIITIGGHYKLVGTRLFLTPIYTKEIVGGHIERSTITAGDDSWSVEGGQIKTLRIQKPRREELTYRFAKTNKGLCIYLDMQPYFRIKT